MVVELVGDPPRYRVRVYGTAVMALRGQDLTGRYLDDPDALPDELRPGFLATYIEAAERREPLLQTVSHRLPNDPTRAWAHNRVVLPFARADRNAVEIFLVALIPVDSSGPTPGGDKKF